jgi:hypothetical protein
MLRAAALESSFPKVVSLEELNPPDLVFIML